MPICLNKYAICISCLYSNIRECIEYTVYCTVYSVKCTHLGHIVNACVQFIKDGKTCPLFRRTVPGVRVTLERCSADLFLRSMLGNEEHLSLEVVVEGDRIQESLIQHSHVVVHDTAENYKYCALLF